MEQIIDACNKENLVVLPLVLYLQLNNIELLSFCNHYSCV